jgi:PAS domain S-box-containing protein
VHYKHLYRKYQTLFDFAPAGYLLVDRQGTIREANLTAARLLKTARSELPGRDLATFIRPDSRSRVDQQLRCCMEGEGHCDTRVAMVAVDGHSFTVHLQSQPESDITATDDSICLCFTDISRETALNRDLALMNTCLEITATATGVQPMLDAFVVAIQDYADCDAVGIRLLQPNGSIPYQAYRGFSRRFYESESPLVLGTDQCMCTDVLVGSTSPDKPFFTSWGSFFTNASSRLLASVPPEQLGRTRNVCNAEGYESVALVPVRRGRRIEGLIHVADRGENRLPADVLLMLESTAQRLGLAMERLAIQSELDHKLADLGHLSIKLIQAQEDEQRRIAMELHDQTGQDLSVLKLRAMEIFGHLPDLAPELTEKCHKLEAFIDKIIEDIRRLSHGLSPAALDVLGLTAAVDAMITDFAGYIDWDITTEIAALEEITDPTAQIAVYRIIQEALHNIYKHAGAKRISIRCRRQMDRLMINISDDGKGFDSWSVRNGRDYPQGLGLAAMRLRARMIGALLEHTSRPEKGTQVRLDLPLTPGKDGP